MNILSRLRLRAKLGLLLVLSAVAMIAIAALGAMTLHQRMLDDRAEKLRAIVSSTVAIASSSRSPGHRTGNHPATGVGHFHQNIRAIRYDHGTGYIAVTDLHTGNVLMHGVNPALEGKPNPTDLATGKPISYVLTEALRSSDEAIATYMFPKPGQTEPLQKLVAVARFAPWDVAIYSGAYTDDLDAPFNASLLRTGAVGGAILLITCSPFGWSTAIPRPRSAA